MAFSLKALRSNFAKFWAQFYQYLLKGMYWGSVPAIILYGLFSKPYSPIMLAVWGFITGKEEQPEYGQNPYGMQGGYQ